MDRNPQWLAGFTSAEGCFFINMIKSPKVSVGYLIKLKFQVTQHRRDEDFMRSIVNYLDCGNIYSLKTRDTIDYCVVKYSDVTNKIILFFFNFLLLV